MVNSISGWQEACKDVFSTGGSRLHSKMDKTLQRLQRQHQWLTSCSYALKWKTRVQRWSNNLHTEMDNRVQH